MIIKWYTNLQESVSTFTNTVVIINNTSITSSEPMIRFCNDSLWFKAVFKTRNRIFGTDEATLRYDVNSACRVVLCFWSPNVVKLELISLNLYIQYCNIIYFRDKMEQIKVKRIKQNLDVSDFLSLAAGKRKVTFYWRPYYVISSSITRHFTSLCWLGYCTAENVIFVTQKTFGK